jgi:hypothetical protein
MHPCFRALTAFHTYYRCRCVDPWAIGGNFGGHFGDASPKLPSKLHGIEATETYLKSVLKVFNECLALIYELPGQKDYLC